MARAIHSSSVHRTPVDAAATCAHYMSMSLEIHLAEILQTSSREQTARTLAVRAGVGVMTAKRALDGKPVRGASARLIASALRELGVETSAGDLALGTEDAS